MQEQNAFKKKVLIAGCGVIGLTTACYLQEQGYEVSIVSKDLPPQTTSAKAAAIWLPFKVEPKDKVNRWSRLAYDYYVELAQIANSGISMIDFIVLAPNNDPPEWLDALPAEAVHPTPSGLLPSGYTFAHTLRVPLIETPIYLQYLWQSFLNSGGTINLQTIEQISDLQQEEKIIINCTGLGSKTLLNDALLYPIQGHLAKIPVKEGIRCIADDDGPNALSYVIPRKDAIILGGTAKANDHNTAVDEATVAAIKSRCSNIEPNIKDLPIFETMVGLRPARTAIRLEYDAQQNIYHNYGHGGGGFTVSWGCAQALAELIASHS
ncbi:MAG: FAD-dependent oxidoreductase [Bacteroidota bacterium]